MSNNHVSGFGPGQSYSAGPNRGLGTGPCYGRDPSYSRPDEGCHSVPILRFIPGTDDPQNAFVSILQ